MLQEFVRSASVSALLILGSAGIAAGMQGAAAVETAEAAHATALPVPPPSDTATFAFEQFYRGTDNALKEFGTARSDHAAIALGIGQCYKELDDPIHWSPSAKAIMLFELDEHLMHSLPSGAITASSTAVKQEPLKLNPFHAAAISFSDRISRDRLEFRRELEDSRNLSKRYQYLILGLGALATIFVSARSLLQGSTKLSGFVGVFAFALSAAGAAASSMNTFEGSTATVLRDQRALSQLQQLH
jgi:hypothetical protein